MKKGRVVLYFVLIVLMTIFNFYLRPIKGNPELSSEYKNSRSYVNELYVSDEAFKKKFFSKDEYYFYEEILAGINQGRDRIMVRCFKGSDCVSLFNLTVEGIMLDHPELLNFQSAATANINSSVLVYNNISSLDPVRYKLGTLRIERIIDGIRKDTENMNDKEKIIYVYNYVASHNYDRGFTFSGSNQSAYSFFTKRSSVCAGFAKTSQLIFQNIGIKSYLVHGNDHMWNYVEYNGKVYVFDATVGASYYDKKSARYYDGLGETTVGETIGMYSDLYPDIETERLRDIFGL